jgi:hypothetical protein
VNWEGKLGALKTHFKAQLSNLEAKLMKMNDQMHMDMDKNFKGILEVKGQNDGIQLVQKSQFKTTDEKKDALENKVTGVHDGIDSFGKELDAMLHRKLDNR